MSDEGRAATPPILRIIGVNDVYSLQQLPRLATLIQRERSDHPGDILLITVAGDFLAPSLLSSLDGGRGMADCFQALGVTHVTLGNHEDDLATEDLIARLEELSATVLLANVTGFAGPSRPADIVRVGPHTVGLVGVVSGEARLYHRPPFGGAAVGPTNEAVIATAQRLRAEGCRAVVALTHQWLSSDRELANAGAVDLVLGGHEHEGFLELDHRVPLVKAPMNARSAVVATVVLEPRVHTSVQLVPLGELPEDPAFRARVDGHLEKVRALEERVLLDLGPGGVVDSTGARFRQTSFGTLVCTHLRDTLQGQAALLNGGALRGANAHHDRLTYADFARELPFDMEAVVVPMPGRVLGDAIRYARARLAGSGGFLQVDDATVVDPEHRVVAVAGEPFDADRTYEVVVPRELLTGIDHIQPLLDWVEVDPTVLPRRTIGIDVKVALLRSFARESARR